MRKKIIIGCICVLVVLAVIACVLVIVNSNRKPSETAASGGASVPKPTYVSALSYASHGIGEENKFKEAALNSDLMDDGTYEHLPIFKFESRAEFEDFKRNVLSGYDLDLSHNDVPSLNTATKMYDENYFKSNTLFLISIPATSGSVRHSVSEVEIADGQFLATIQANSPNAVTMDLVSWFIVISVDSAAVSECTYFDAVIE